MDSNAAALDLYSHDLHGYGLYSYGPCTVLFNTDAQRDPAFITALGWGRRTLLENGGTDAHVDKSRLV